VSALAALSVNACLLTSRLDEKPTGLLVSRVSPRRISGNRLATFMEAYLNQCGKRELFNDEEFFEGCRRLSLIVGDREITALLAKSYAEQMIATREGTTDDALPQNIPDLMLNYVHLINRSPAPDAPDTRAVHRAAQTAAWACLQQTYRPATARYADVLAALDGVESAALLAYLEQPLKLIRINDAGREHLRF